MEIEERFWSKIDWKLTSNGCWIWNGALTKYGYGKFRLGNDWVHAHKMAFSLEVSEVPKKLVIDHVCHNPIVCKDGTSCIHRRCCNVNHMNIITHEENVSKGRAVKPDSRTHCPKGHEYDETNTRLYHGARHCRACDRNRPQRKKLV